MERKAKEEQKQREIEIQRRKMKQMNISKPSAGSVDELIAIPVAMKTGGGSGGGGKKQTNSPLLSKATETTKKGWSMDMTVEPIYNGHCISRSPTYFY